ncbi:MAG: ribonuclease P protein component [Actinomycetota bacterium]|nr:ribonuclease P protein component [Actinomycetota bacterium]
MLPAAYRLRSAAQFRAVTRGGSKAARRSVIAYVLPPSPSEPTLSTAMAGLIVSRSVGGSVVRHRVARRLRASVVGLLPALPSGTTVVLRALPGAAEDPELSAQVAGAIDQALGRAVTRSR